MNKLVWSGLGWNPDADVIGYPARYSRYFIGAQPYGIVCAGAARAGAQLARSVSKRTLVWSRHLRSSGNGSAGNAGTEAELAIPASALSGSLRRVHPITAVGRKRAGRTRPNMLRDAKRRGALDAMAAAEAALRPDPVAADLRARTFELAEALFQSIRMQLSVPRYQAIAVGRGANLDLIDHPLNNGPWLRAQFSEIRAMGSESDRLNAIDSIVNWTNPGQVDFTMIWVTR